MIDKVFLFSSILSMLPPSLPPPPLPLLLLSVLMLLIYTALLRVPVLGAGFRY